MRSLRVAGGAAAAACAVLLGACGGGGGGSSAPPPPAQTQNPDVALTLSTKSVSVSATTADPAPTATVSVDVTPHPPAGTVIYIVEQHTTHGIASIAGSGNGPLTATITFDSPATLGLGTYSDTLSINACFDQACTQPVHDSPQSVAVAYAVTAPLPASVTQYSPTQVDAGNGDFTLTLLGQNFTASSVVRWNGSARTTTFVSATELLAHIPAADVASVGSANVDVATAGSATTPAVVQINAPSKDAVSFQINTAHTGAVSFQGISFPTTSTWSVDLGAPTSNALIAGGKVFVIAGEPFASAPSNTLFALDAATGATVWTEPVGVHASLAYDSGKLIVLFETPAIDGLLQILDAATGNALVPPIQLISDENFLSAPVARDGLIFVAAPALTSLGNAVVMYAIGEQSGAILWQQQTDGSLPVSTPVVTADGVYLSFTSLDYAFRPLTGESIWSGTLAAPPTGDGATGLVAGSNFFAPDVANTYNGHVYNAATGALQGTYTADVLPAIGAQAGYFLTGGTLVALSLNGFTPLWSFAGDGHLATSPLLVGNYVIIGSNTGNLYAVNASDGTQAWVVSVGAPLPAGVGFDGVTPYSSLSAGDGLLVVPAGNTLTAYTLSTNP